jgi:hypothetical protein
MNRGLKRFRVVVATATVLCVLPPLAGAVLVSTDRAIDQGVADQDRARVQAFLDRADAREQLQALGVDDLVVKHRVAGLTDREVHALVQQLDTLPAGGELSNRKILAVVLIVFLVLLLI